MVILAVHGGAGGDGPWRGLTRADPARLRCMEALLGDLGQRMADGEINALEAVTLAVEAMENEPLFNAGIGSVLDAAGTVTMDASIMRGEDRAAGAVVNLRTSQHPIRVANHLLKQGWPVMIVGEAADVFGEKQGVQQIDNADFVTELRQAQWEKWNLNTLRPGATDEDDEAALDHDLEDRPGMGTVGAVALDIHGHVAAATSTGGMTGKPDGRVGDTPIIGAGTWADGSVAISCTGVGEAFIRTCAARTMAFHHTSMGLEGAAETVLNEVAPLGGRGGLIAVDTEGNVVLPFQTMLMYRGKYEAGIVDVAVGPEWERNDGAVSS